ncbi:MAG: nucleotidyltransferase family protein [Pseudobdellovibrionaceae bacterium]
MNRINIPDQAFILAAGIGSRLRPYTDMMPKPMVPVAGKAVIDHILDKLVAAGVKQAVINLHHRGDQLRQHLATRTDIAISFSDEEELLETGGGLKKGLPLLDADKPFYAVNGDAFWEDTQNSQAFIELGKMWNVVDADILLMLQPVSSMILTRGVGDYDLDAAGRAVRNKERTGPYMFAGVRIVNPAVFAGTPDGAFSFLRCMDEAEAKGRLYGMVHNNPWHHISTPDEYMAVEEALQQAK